MYMNPTNHDYVLVRKSKERNTEITREISMNYDNYEAKIVERYGVELRGWPLAGSICNPGAIGPLQDLSQLQLALSQKICRWEILTEEEVQERRVLNAERVARGEQVYKARKTPSNRTPARTDPVAPA